jgi:ribosome-associated heat shock protein Hsp15
VSNAIRLDVWLDVACLFKTRSEAKRACEGGKVDANGQTAKPNRLVREGDRIRIGRPYGRHQDVIVRLLIDQHVKKSQAKALFDDVTPKPSAEELEMRRMERVYRAATRAAGTPDRRQRRELRRVKERG